MVGERWNTTPYEHHLPRRADALVPDAALRLSRAVDVAAPPEHVFRWLCQLRVAPYSYDVLDNAGRESPQELTPGLDDLVPGQRFMTIFRLADVVDRRELTLEHDGALGHVAATYAVAGDGRLLLVIAWDAPLALGPALALGDLVMARRQLLNLKRLAERTAPGP
jgi:hypothetical protein